jgi:hypothetical protein
MTQQRKPTGTELAYAQKLNKEVQDLRSRGIRLGLALPGSPGIASGHALEGVRVNGWQRECGILLALNRLEAAAESLNAWAKTVADFANVVDFRTSVLREEFNHRFQLCPSCEGNQGKGRTGHGPGYDWEDCENCDGRGFIPTGQKL